MSRVYDSLRRAIYWVSKVLVRISFNIGGDYSFLRLLFMHEIRYLTKKKILKKNRKIVNCLEKKPEMVFCHYDINSPNLIYDEEKGGFYFLSYTLTSKVAIYDCLK